MAGINGIFEPFFNFVKKQLALRKLLINSSILRDPQTNLTNLKGESQKKDFERLGISPEAFFKYTTEKQCFIRMASGVDVRKESETPEDSTVPYILEKPYETGEVDPTYNLRGPNLAKQYILESGTQFYNKGGKFGGNRESFVPNNLTEDKGRAFAYGDKNIRANAKDGFGIVPMPGILDANITTKSDDGSVRIAQVNWVCHNRRQLSALEALYMRPGYPILLEWGWAPYIVSNTARGETLKVINENYPILEDFFDPTSNINDLNDTIRIQKENSQGNYDGFIGYVRNFTFKVREDGGYDCMTELVAHGEILESLKTQRTHSPKLPSPSNYNASFETEPIDEFLYYLRSILVSVAPAGDRLFLKLMGTTAEKDTDRSGGGVGGTRYVTWKDNEDNIYDFQKLNKTAPLYKTGFKEIIDTIQEIGKSTTKELDKTREGEYNVPAEFSNDYNELNVYNQVRGFRRGEGELGNYETFDPFVGNELGSDAPSRDQFDSNLKDTEKYNIQSGNSAASGKVLSERREKYLGFDSLLDGTILKELSLTDNTEEDSGVRLNVYVRWDLICSIFNQLISPPYKDNHKLVELTYLKPRVIKSNVGGENDPLMGFSKIWDGKTAEDLSEGSEMSKINSDNSQTYIDYSSPVASRLFPYDGEEHPPFLGGSFDTGVCLMPHQLKSIEQQSEGKRTEEGLDDDEYYTIHGSYRQSKDQGLKLNGNLTSYKNTTSPDNSIGLIYFNLDHLISRYEELAIEEKQTDIKGKIKYEKRLNNDFSIHDFFTTIWNDVNDACAGYYDFGLSVEHERPNIVRVIDFTFKSKGITLDDIFKFNPQGLDTTSRDFFWTSKLDSDFASAISIAAQSSTEIQSLEALSFKAFHKNIKNRFTDIKYDASDTSRQIKQSLQGYIYDYNQYLNNVKSLREYMERLNESNYETAYTTTGPGRYRKNIPINSETAKLYAKELEKQRISLESRYPTHDNDGNRYDGSEAVNGKYTGQYRNNTTHFRSAIIPLTTSLTLDGISGIVPLSLFRIDPDKLPNGYQDESIIFTVKSETQKITQTQDWTTEITGYLTLLDTNPNKGKNENETFDDIMADLDNIDKERKEWIKYVTNVPWSACFISWCIDQITTTKNIDFKTHPMHTGYIEENKDNNSFLILDPKTTPITVGDILVRPTKDTVDINTVKYKENGSYSGFSHGVIVYDISGGKAKIIGGNYGDKVAREKDVPLSANGIMYSSSEEDYFHNGVIFRPDFVGFENIARMAENELANWDPTWTERAVLAEDTVRRYYSSIDWGSFNLDPPPEKQ